MNWLNVELSTDCNKACHFCGRAKARKDGLLERKYMPQELFDSIIEEFKGEIIQFNKDGEPLMYPGLGHVGATTRHLVTNIVTNGILLWDRKDELIDFDTITVSVIEDDANQFNTVKRFIEAVEKPKVYIKFLGAYDNPEYAKLGLKTMRRVIHNPEGDTDYQGAKPPIPELGICLDFLYKPAIDVNGFVHICNRYDPEHKGVLGNIRQDPLRWLWGSPLRENWLKLHKEGQREFIPLCGECEFWGVPNATV